ncbi:HDOD domain-containing protein [Variovorax sp. J22P240]|uniref:EAL and HDOD domain-containing protein n=1 Tax=Variovorax sp. J22P240 TaxID=3053514 RepID=UPI002576639C|nr:HDOD domain-containing protein [Variovorax sp. J22P240]MDM0002167.1 HDOD domain-containing protein [Variovorax sp. J22P240]
MRFDFFRRQGTTSEPVAAERGERTEPMIETRVPAYQPPEPRGANGFVTYALQLDAQKRVRGYRLAWRAAGGGPEAPDASAQSRALLSCVSRHLNSGKGSRLGRLVLFLDVTVDTLFQSELQALPPESVVLCMGLDDLMDADTRSMLLFLREQGFGFMLCNAEALPHDPALLEVITHFDVGSGDSDLVASVRNDRLPEQPRVQLIATRMNGWDNFDACAARHVDVFVDGDHPPPPVEKGAAMLQPESMLIVRLMQMIQRNEDVRSIESALKRDAALTYRLLRHINSPAIGAGVEITSLRHAVAMLGYSPLYRWLSLLLATSNKTSSPFMMKKAIMRGRFVELMGHGMLPSSEADNLFVVGMFSLVDQLLGISMQEVFAKVQLAESVQQAILHREGVYAPFLALVEACETGTDQAGRFAEALFVSAEQVNAAHLSAMVWSHEVSAVEIGD